MSVTRMDNVGIVVEDLDAAISPLPERTVEVRRCPFLETESWSGHDLEENRQARICEMMVARG